MDLTEAGLSILHMVCHAARGCHQEVCCTPGGGIARGLRPEMELQSTSHICTRHPDKSSRIVPDQGDPGKDLPVVRPMGDELIHWLGGGQIGRGSSKGSKCGAVGGRQGGTGTTFPRNIAVWEAAPGHLGVDLPPRGRMPPIRGRLH